MGCGVFLEPTGAAANLRASTAPLPSPRPPRWSSAERASSRSHRRRFERGARSRSTRGPRTSGSTGPLRPLHLPDQPGQVPCGQRDEQRDGTEPSIASMRLITGGFDRHDWPQASQTLHWRAVATWASWQRQRHFGGLALPGLDMSLPGPIECKIFSQLDQCSWQAVRERPRFVLVEDVPSKSSSRRLRRSM